MRESPTTHAEWTPLSPYTLPSSAGCSHSRVFVSNMCTSLEQWIEKLYHNWTFTMYVQLKIFMTQMKQGLMMTLLYLKCWLLVPLPPITTSRCPTAVMVWNDRGSGWQPLITLFKSNVHFRDSEVHIIFKSTAHVGIKKMHEILKYQILTCVIYV